jgi:hypothetical protein
MPCQAQGKAIPNVSHHPPLHGTPCDRRGNDLPYNSPPPPNERAETDFTTFKHGAEFNSLLLFIRMTAHLLPMQMNSTRNSVSESDIA